MSPKRVEWPPVTTEQRPNSLCVLAYKPLHSLASFLALQSHAAHASPDSLLSLPSRNNSSPFSLIKVLLHLTIGLFHLPRTSPQWFLNFAVH